MRTFDCVKFVERHPLRRLRPESSPDLLFNQALILSNFSIELLNLELPMPLSQLEKILESENIVIENISRSLPQEAGFAPFIAWTDTEPPVIHLDEKALEKLAQSRSAQIGNQRLSHDVIREIILAHEWFHIIFINIIQPRKPDFPKTAEWIIVEEIAARIFSARVSGNDDHPFIIDDLIENAFYLKSKRSLEVI